ncbi:MAG: aspartate aminotransferase family protein [Dehalococcoidales bacterium]|nr:aspartate aminotransferase family protein [Dehalococcoidales bacterium]
MSTWQALEDQYYLRTFTRIPVVITKGEGAHIWDDTGKQYLDFLGGLAVTVLGHCHPAVTEAIKEQAQTLIQTTNLVYTIPQLQLAELLINNSCLQRVFFANSGAEANEGAVKLARRWGKLKLNGAYEVITALNSFHGRTLAMVAATGQAKFQEPYEPVPIGFKSIALGDIDVLKQATTKETCAVMLELIQGEGGVLSASEDYFKAVREWCNQKGILLILDEIQTGMGRLGTLWGYQQFGIEPDIMTLAKGLANGVPIGVVMAKEKASVFVPGDHGSTFGGNPLACAAGFATLKYIIEKDIPGNAKKVGDYFLAGLEKLKQKYAFITSVRGRGLLLAIEFNKEIAQAALMACLENGLLVNKVKPNALRFIPALVITKKDVDEALAILDKSLAGINV